MHQPSPAPPPGVPPWIPTPPAGVQMTPIPDSPPPPNIARDDEWTPVLRGWRHVNIDHAPIATCTQARLATPNRFALLTDSAAEATSCSMTRHMALPVLDPASGHMLEHHQLRTHPDYKSVWDTSYANELGRLCHCIGTNNNKPTGKRIDGTNTFCPITYTEIPSDR
jgi:hypothetical protein